MTTEELISNLKNVRKASRKLVTLSDFEINQILISIADKAQFASAEILAANQKDLARMDPNNPKYDRLLLNENRLTSICQDIRKVAELTSPLNHKLEAVDRPNGLHIERISVPLGVVAIVFESRPNVTFDVVALCLKSGNACVLKGSRDAQDSNRAIVEVIQSVLREHDLEQTVYLAPSEREFLPVILNAVNEIDVVIPRGSQELINAVREMSKVPVIETGAGIVHTYFDATGDLEKGKAIITNAKARRVSVCNALDTLIIHESRLAELPELLSELGEKYKAEVFADEKAENVLRGQYQGTLHQATNEDFGQEFLSMKLSVKTVSSLDEALEHISLYSSRHSEAIVSEDQASIELFLKSVDAAVVYANSSTAFTDGGEFGMGAEIGISTQKLHARGPMALRELTSYKWIVTGNGQIRS
ncbi:MAG: glutamate-5-semialdehyde dehydrogenase [Bacteroidetes bacterium]|nr:glutamate-5-semialdehyde dehydrogenase [Bacteroidota bacterium]